jgi:hypothetical protein
MPPTDLSALGVKYPLQIAEDPPQTKLATGILSRRLPRFNGLFWQLLPMIFATNL